MVVKTEFQGVNSEFWVLSGRFGGLCEPGFKGVKE